MNGFLYFMAIIDERFTFFLIVVATLSITQWVTYRIYKKTRKKSLSLLATLGLTLVGVGIMVYMTITEINDIGSWIQLALLILGIWLVIVVVISLVLSFILFYVVDRAEQKKNKP